MGPLGARRFSFMLLAVSAVVYVLFYYYNYFYFFCLRYHVLTVGPFKHKHEANLAKSVSELFQRTRKVRAFFNIYKLNLMCLIFLIFVN